MLRSMDSGVSALDQFQQELDVIGNNIANVNTTGFKAAVVEFATTLSQTIGANAAGSLQVGTGVKMNTITNQFTQGAPTNTGVATDVAVSGNGFFVVKDTGTGQSYVTRDGHFSVDNNGYLITSTGMRVQGYTDSSHSAVGDIQFSNANAPGGDTASVSAYKLNNDGTTDITLSDGTEFEGGQILLQSFTTPTQLLNVGNNLYSGMAAAGPSTLTAPSAAGPGTLQVGALEMSNVDLASQLTALITTQRAYEANTKVITTSDEILQDLVNLKR